MWCTRRLEEAASGENWQKRSRGFNQVSAMLMYKLCCGALAALIWRRTVRSVIIASWAGLAVDGYGYSSVLQVDVQRRRRAS